MDNRNEVREFLASRRAKVTPEQVGLVPSGSRRRVAGLRREEAAMLSGVSIDYYTRIERGNLSGVSDAVLDAISRALMLNEAERDHLVNLARTANRGTRVRAAKQHAQTLRPTLQHLLDSLTGAVAIVGNTRLDLVAANDLGYALYSEMFRTSARPANHSRFIFLDPRAHDLYPDWERTANVNVEILRRNAGRTPFDKDLTELVGELSMRSDEFRVRWAAHDVRRHYSGAKTFHHRVVGTLELNFHVMELEDDPGHTLTVYTPEPGSASEEGLQLLANWAATERVADAARNPGMQWTVS